jgi:hypothetical protein
LSPDERRPADNLNFATKREPQQKSFLKRTVQQLCLGKSFLYPDFTNRPDQKSSGLNPGDSANPNTTKKSFLFRKELT